MMTLTPTLPIRVGWDALTDSMDIMTHTIMDRIGERRIGVATMDGTTHGMALTITAVGTIHGIMDTMGGGTHTMAGPEVGELHTGTTLTMVRRVHVTIQWATAGSLAVALHLVILLLIPNAEDSVITVLAILAVAITIGGAPLTTTATVLTAVSSSRTTKGRHLAILPVALGREMAISAAEEALAATVAVLEVEQVEVALAVEGNLPEALGNF